MERPQEVGEHFGNRLDVEHPQLLDHGLERHGGGLVLAAREREMAFELWDEDLALRLGVVVQDRDGLMVERFRLLETTAEQDRSRKRGEPHPPQGLVAHRQRELESLALELLALLEVAEAEADVTHAPGQP